MDTSKVLLNDNELVVTYGASTKEQRADCYNRYKIEAEEHDDVVLNSKLFVDVSYPLYELWENDQLVGLLNIDLSSSSSESSSVITISIEGVMLLDEARGRDFSLALGSTAAEHIATTYQLDKISPNDNRTVYVSADLESEAGESFVEDFYDELSSFNSDADKLFLRDWSF
ncbi:hypothetical protein KW419_21095 [Vibrio fluvialis]|nr:hypothetical protein [Vibrio fluvialis]